MKLKTLLALAVAGAFAVPFAAQASADGDRIILAQAGGPSGASSTGTGATGGTPSAQSSGEPKAPTQKSNASRAASAPAFSTLDKNSDGQISQAEWDAHYRSGSAATGGASGSAATGGASTSPAPSGPGTKSQAGTGSDTATSPGTSGKGKAQ